MGKPGKRGVGNQQPHAVRVEAERDGTVPSMAVFRGKEELISLSFISIDLFH